MRKQIIIDVPEEYEHCDFFLRAVWWDRNERRNRFEEFSCELKDLPLDGQHNSIGEDDG